MDRYPVLGNIDANLTRVELAIPALADMLQSLLAMAVDLEADMHFTNRDYLNGDDAASWSSEPDYTA